MTGPAFAIARAGEDAVDEVFVGIGSGISGEGCDFGGCGGEAVHDEVESADEGGAIGCGGGLELVFGQLGLDEGVDGVGGGRGLGGGRRGVLEGLEGPVIRGEGVCRVRVGFRHGCAGLDPVVQELDLLGWEAGAVWRHGVGEICGRNELDDVALVGVAGDQDRFSGVASTLDRCGGVEPESGLLFFGSVTADAVICEEGLDIGFEVDGLGCCGLEEAGGEEGEEDSVGGRCFGGGSDHGWMSELYGMDSRGWWFGGCLRMWRGARISQACRAVWGVEGLRLWVVGGGGRVRACCSDF
ncbi:MAG: hypothetical protein RI897_3013 [Verrucomicrobiota bacterium]